MKVLLIFIAILWIIVLALALLFSKKYKVVDAKCVNAEVCNNISEKEGFVFFEYEYDFGKGKDIYYGKATTISRVSDKKSYKILVTKEYNERVIVFADVRKLFISMIILSLLLVLLCVYSEVIA